MGYQAQGRSSPEIRQSHLDTIEVTRILKALMGHIDGNKKMSSTQVRAAEILLRKKLPDLKASELTGADGGPLTVTVLDYAQRHDTE